MLKKDYFSCRVPLRQLNAFFEIDAIYPQKRVIQVDLVLSPSSKTLIIGPDAQKNVKLRVRKIELRLQYVELEPTIRTEWYGSIERNKLTRVFPTYRTSHRTIRAGQEQEFLPAVMSFGLLPEFVAVVFQKESIHCGNYENPFSYNSCDVKSLKLSKNGIGHFLNHESTGMKVVEDSHKHYLWYDEFLKCFGKEASSIGPDRFFHDLFVFTFDLSCVPTFWEHDKCDNSAKLNLVSAGVIDLEVTFDKPTDTNLIVCVIGYQNSIASFNPNGEIVNE